MAQRLYESLEFRTSADERDMRLKLALRAANIGFWDWDLTSGMMDYSPEAKCIFGFPADKPVTFDQVRNATHPDDLPWTSALARRSLDPEIRDHQPYEYRINRVDTGETRWVLAFGEPIFVDQGGGLKAVRYLGTVQDITDRKLSEYALRENETRLRLAIDAARLAVWEFDIRSETIKTTEDLNRLFALPPGYKPTIEELRSFYLPGERERVHQASMKAIEEGRTNFEVEFEYRRFDGVRRWFFLRAEMIANTDGDFERVIGVLMDIDDQKRAREQQALVVGELNHRVKNILAVVQSLVSQTFNESGVNSSSVQKISERIRALAKANDVLAKGEWTHGFLADIVTEVTSPFREGLENRIVIGGPPVSIPANLNVPVALAIHELCTNAIKYGALSGNQGQVRIVWKVDESGRVTIEWSESGGPAVKPPKQSGFGTRLLRKGLASSMGEIELHFRREGLLCRMTIGTQEREDQIA